MGLIFAWGHFREEDKRENAKITRARKFPRLQLLKLKGNEL